MIAAPAIAVKVIRDIVDCRLVGEVVKEKEVRISDDGIELNLSLDELRGRWDSAIEREV